MTAWTVPGRVSRIIDGDTLVIDLDQGWHTWRIGEHVRLVGINCPELRTPDGPMARSFTASLTPEGALVTVVSHSLDKYGRVLGQVVLADGRVLNDELLKAGFAVPMAG